MSTQKVALDYQGDLEASNDVLQRRIGGSFASPLRCNWAATVAPGAANDSSQGYAVGSFWMDTTADRVWVCIDPTAGAAIWKRLDNLVFGTEFEEFSSTADSTTTSTSNQTKISATTASKPAGTYLIKAEARLASGTANREFGVTAQVDGVTQHAEHVSSTIRTNNGSAYHYSEFFLVTFGSVGAHSLSLLYRAVGTSSTITINWARLTIWRVS